EAGEEGGECLAGACGCQDESVLTRRDGRPALALGRRRLSEGLAKPLTDGGQEQVEGVADFHVLIVQVCASWTERTSEAMLLRRPVLRKKFICARGAGKERTNSLAMTLLG